MRALASIVGAILIALFFFLWQNTLSQKSDAEEQLQRTVIALDAAENRADLAEQQIRAIVVGTYVNYVLTLLEGCKQPFARGLEQTMDDAMNALRSGEVDVAEANADEIQTSLPIGCKPGGGAIFVDDFMEFFASGQLFQVQPIEGRGSG